VHLRRSWVADIERPSFGAGWALALEAEEARNHTQDTLEEECMLDQVPEAV
jgi:hypothetical protein